MWEIIIAVVLIIMVVKQGHRITRLEKLLEGKVVASTKPEEKKQGVSLMESAPMVSGVPVSASVPDTGVRDVLESPRLSSEEASGRFLGKIGIAAVLVGVAFFLKYA